jgi:hypothetical protein
MAKDKQSRKRKLDVTSPERATARNEGGEPKEIKPKNVPENEIWPVSSVEKKGREESREETSAAGAENFNCMLCSKQFAMRRFLYSHYTCSHFRQEMLDREGSVLQLISLPR